MNINIIKPYSKMTDKEKVTHLESRYNKKIEFIDALETLLLEHGFKVVSINE